MLDIFAGVRLRDESRGGQCRSSITANPQSYLERMWGSLTKLRIRVLVRVAFGYAFYFYYVIEVIFCAGVKW